MEFFGIPLFILLAFLAAPLTIIDFLWFLVKGKRTKLGRTPLLGYMVLVPGNLLIWLDDENNFNSCCGGWTFFSPAHRFSVYLLMWLCTGAYFYCSHRKRLASPVVEVVVNCLLLTGVVLYAFISIQGDDVALFLVYPLPCILLLILLLIQNHQRIIKEMEEQGDEMEAVLSANGVVQFCWFLLRQVPWKKFPVLLVLCLPLLVCLAAILLLFGQQPDSLVRAFTDTYKHGLSQLQKDCNGVSCDGHFLCTVAAKGHPRLVRPLRTGVRAGMPIKCNRQLLIANAFEEWLEQRMPVVHAPVRKLYNRIGSFIHRYYGAFDRKWVSNLVYLLMKPLEWSFLLTLYLVDRRPETRIAQQYMSRADREEIKQLKKS